MRPVGEIEKGVLFGNDGYLFLAEGAHSPRDVLLGVKKIDRQSFINFEQNILERAAVCANEGAKFLHVISPDKHSVMVDQFPIRDPIYIGARYVEALPSVGEFVFYPQRLLQRADQPTFMRTDTHNTEYGNVLTAAAIVGRVMRQDQSGNVRKLLSAQWVDIDRVGDLGGRFEPPIGEVRKVIQKKWRHHWRHNNLSGGNNGIVDVIFCPESVYPERILIFGDSFGRDLASILFFFFREVVFLRTPYFHRDIFDQVKPDILITQNVERYLDFCNSDEMRPSFFMYPHLAQVDYAPEKSFAEAFSAVLSYGRPPHEQYLIKNDLLAAEPVS
jgi:SGNH hydrolase-like domain, acetyltransferase AlgX